MGRSLREENQISDLKPYVQSVLIILGFSIWQFAYKSDAGRDGGQEEKGMTEDKMAGSHHQLDGHEFEWTPRVGDGQGGLLLLLLVLLLSCFSHVWLCAAPEMAAHQAPLSLGFSRQEHWCAAIHGVTKSRTRLSYWTELNWTEYVSYTLLHQNTCLSSSLFHILTYIVTFVRSTFLSGKSLVTILNLLKYCLF